MTAVGAAKNVGCTLRLGRPLRMPPWMNRTRTMILARMLAIQLLKLCALPSAIAPGLRFGALVSKTIMQY